MKTNWEKLNKDLIELGMEPITPPKTAEQLRKETKEKADSLSIETKKIFWQAMLNGKNVGEARELAGIDDIMVASELVIQNHNVLHIPKTIDEIN